MTDEYFLFLKGQPNHQPFKNALSLGTLDSGTLEMGNRVTIYLKQHLKNYKIKGTLIDNNHGY